MQKFFRLVMALCLLSALSACSWLSRKIPIEQGNVMTQTMVNQLKPGMTMSQVEQIMGEPVLNSTFDPNRLDYVYTYTKGKEYKYQRVTLIFKDNQLLQISGTLVPDSQY